METFQSPCGDLFSGKEIQYHLGHKDINKFQSPCRELVSGKEKHTSEVNYPLLFQSPFGDLFSGKICKPQQQWLDGQSFSPLAGIYLAESNSPSET